MRTIDVALSGRRSNLDLLRLLAALSVLWAHSYPLTGNNRSAIFSKMIFGYDSVGSLAVAIFFAISGLLVTRSAASRSVAGFLVARCLRIFPALILCVVTTVLVIGPLLTKLPVMDYFEDPSTSAYLGNISLWDLRFNLADTTQGLPYPYAINGSLWTLGIEFCCYIMVLVLVRMRAMETRTAVFTVGIVAFALFYCVYGLHMDAQQPGPNIHRGLPLYPILKNATVFLIGGGLWVYRKYIPLSPWIALACVLALVAGAGTIGAQAIYILTLPYLVVYIAVGLPALVDLSATIGDLSYGIYLFAFPVQQATIAFLGPGAEAPVVSSIATVIAGTIAFMSWRFVERPALKLKLRAVGGVLPLLGERT